MNFLYIPVIFLFSHSFLLLIFTFLWYFLKVLFFSLSFLSLSIGFSPPCRLTFFFLCCVFRLCQNWERHSGPLIPIPLSGMQMCVWLCDPPGPGNICRLNNKGGPLDCSRCESDFGPVDGNCHLPCRVTTSLHFKAWKHEHMVSVILF